MKMGLLKPIWMKEELEGKKLVDALFKVRGMTSQSELCKVAVQAPHGEVANAAIKLIDDQAFLARLALGQEPTASSSAPSSAAFCLDDQEALMQVARMSPYGHARIAAMEKIGDAATVADIARRAADPYERKRGLEAARRRVAHCADGELLQLAMGDADLCEEAVNALDEPLLKLHPNPVREGMAKSIALSSPFEAAWRKALGILRPIALVQLAREDASGERGQAAVRKLLSEGLTQLADDEAYDEVVALLADVALQDSDDAMLAVGPIPWGHEALAGIARSAKRLEVRKAAIWKLADQDLLLQLALSDPDVAVDAAARLTGQYAKELAIECFDPVATANDASLSDVQKEMLFNAAAEAVGRIDDLRIARQAVAKIATGACTYSAQAAIRAQGHLEKLEKSYRKFFCAKCGQPVCGTCRTQSADGFEFRCGCPDGSDESNWEVVIDEDGERADGGEFHMFKGSSVWVCTTCHGLKSSMAAGKMPVKPRCKCEGAWPYKGFFEFMESGDEDAIAIAVRYQGDDA